MNYLNIIYHTINGDNMKNNSIWTDTKISKNYKSLDKDINVDILIIGGGITGINALYNLKDKDVILVERNKLANAVTRNTTGKLTYLQDNTYINILKKDINKANLYLKSQLDSIKYAKDIIKSNKINCDFTKTKSYLFTSSDNNINKIKVVKNFLENNNIKVSENDMPILDYKYNISVDDTYLFNPIKYIDGLVNLIDDNKIYENTKIVSIDYVDNKYICKTDNNKITANKIVLATHYPYFIFPYLFPMKSSLEKSYIISYKNKKNNLSIINVDNPSISVRTYKDNVLFLTNSRNITSNVNDKNNFDDLFHKKDIDHIWSNIDIITNDYIPYIGYINDNFILATGFNTWGMTNSIISGKIIKDLIDKKDNEYIKLFDPKRNLNNIKIISDIFSTIKGYYQGIVNKNSQIKYDKLNGEDVLIYNDTVVKRKCPHAKCNLLYNEVENTFDCPCHGSRFDINGKCFNGPSNYNITINKITK